MKYTLSAITALLAISQCSAQWPTFHGNNQRTGRSSATGSATPEIIWSYDLQGPMINSPVVGPDGTIYTGSVWSETLLPSAFIHAINPDGTVKWRYELGFYDDQTESSPALGPEGNVYVGTPRNFFVALNSSGQEIWRFTTLDDITTNPVVAPNGTVYAKLDGFLFAFTPTGQVLWQFPIGSNWPGSPAMALDGTIYVPGAGGLFAINPNGTQKWKFIGPDSFSSPAVADNGNIIYASGNTYSINPNTGGIVWIFNEAISPWSAPTIDAQGNIFIVDGWNLRKLSPAGGLLWERDFLYDVNRLESSYSAPIVDAANRLYFGLGTGKRYALESAKGLVTYDGVTGTKLDNLLLPEAPSTSSPAMAPDGTIYIGCLDGKLYALGDGWSAVQAQQYTLVRGSLFGGGLADLHTSNNVSMSLRPGVTLSGSQRPIVLELESTVPAGSIASMQFVIESRTTSTSIRQWLELYNFTNATWVSVDSRMTSLTDQRIEIPITAMAEYMESGTRRVLARISYKAEGPVLSFPWTSSIDQAVWRTR